MASNIGVESLEDVEMSPVESVLSIQQELQNYELKQEHIQQIRRHIVQYRQLKKHNDSLRRNTQLTQAQLIQLQSEEKNIRNEILENMNDNNNNNNNNCNQRSVLINYDYDTSNNPHDESLDYFNVVVINGVEYFEIQLPNGKTERFPIDQNGHIITERLTLEQISLIINFPDQRLLPEHNQAWTAYHPRLDHRNFKPNNIFLN